MVLLLNSANLALACRCDLPGFFASSILRLQPQLEPRHICATFLSFRTSSFDMPYSTMTHPTLHALFAQHLPLLLWQWPSWWRRRGREQHCRGQQRGHPSRSAGRCVREVAAPSAHHTLPPLQRMDAARWASC